MHEEIAMSASVLEANLRNELGKNQVKQVKKQGFIPAIIYGSDKETIPVSLDPRDLYRVFRNDLGRNVPIQLNVKNGDNTITERVISYQFERDPISQKIVHVDFKRLNDNEKVKISVKLIVTGIAPGVKAGGVFIKKLERVELSCFPNDIPAPITIDISSMRIGDTVFVRNLDLHSDIDVLTHPDSTIVRVASPRGKTVDEEIEEAANSEAAENAADSASSSDAENTNSN